MTRSRTPEPPYCWQSKEALRKLREHLDGDSILPYAIAIYGALTENASNKGEESFTTLQSHIATLAGGISTRTIRRVLPVLREIGILDYETPRLKGPITFHLLSVGTESPNDRTISPNVRTPMNSGFQSYNRSNREEQEKNKEENSSPVSPKRPSRPAASRIQLVDESHILELKKIYQPQSVNKAIADCRAWLLTPKGYGKSFSKRRLQTFLRDAEPLTDESANGSDPAAPTVRPEIDAKIFADFLAKEYPHRATNWTPADAPEAVIREFQNQF